MPNWFWILLTGLHVLSFLWYFLICRDLNRFTKTRIAILGKENEKWVKTPKLRYYRLLYFFVLVLVTLFTYFVFFYASF